MNKLDLIPANQWGIGNLEDLPDGYILFPLPIIEPIGVDSPQSVSLVEEEVICGTNCQQDRQESKSQVLSEQSVSLEHAEFIKEGQDNIILG